MKELTKVHNRWAAVGALAASALAVALFSPAPARAAAAQQGLAGQSVSASTKIAALPCTMLRIGGSAATVRLWWCDGTQGTGRGYHGQAYLAGGGAVWLVSGAGTPTAFRTSSVSGWFDTPDVGDYGAPWKACKHNGPITSPTECTGYATK
ncbi:hypothetical protein ACIBQ1_37625 [Nonomuraea sp. NPDC050153]|uniref:hypothetical protein n=1 Tax=Nonomuraea sp. NPDC050153 TaxID=3364359 RepID=UPI0037B6F1BA